MARTDGHLDGGIRMTASPSPRSEDIAERGGHDFLATGNIVAGNSHILPEILEMIRKVFSGTVEK